MKRYYAYYAILAPSPDGFSVYFPDLDGAVSVGDSFDDAVFNAEECLALHVYGMQKHEYALPTPSKRKEITVPDGCQIALISTDLKEYFPEDFEDEEEEEPEKKSWGGARSGAGRPKNSGRQATRRLVVRMTEEEDELLTRLAVAAQKNKSDFVRDLIKNSV